MSGDLFDQVGTALVTEMRHRRISRIPIGRLVVVTSEHITGWDDTRCSPNFILRRSPDNPRGSWGEDSANADAEISANAKAEFAFIAVSTSDVSPRRWVMMNHPFYEYCWNHGMYMDHIPPEFNVGRAVIWQHTSHTKWSPGLQARSIFARLWARLAQSPNVTIEAGYYLGDQVARVLLAARFEEDAWRLGYGRLNMELFGVEPPAAWGCTPHACAAASIRRKRAPALPLETLGRRAGIKGQRVLCLHGPTVRRGIPAMPARLRVFHVRGKPDSMSHVPCQDCRHSALVCLGAAILVFFQKRDRKR